ncbi:hypothetical protein ThrDRAFT_03239 [Frankia casuarinae]|jgi:hypothetical protein|nr:hypothetical protein ThrDRAFT_03239 [Frankia casuarinae]
MTARHEAGAAGRMHRLPVTFTSQNRLTPASDSYSLAPHRHACWPYSRLFAIAMNRLLPKPWKAQCTRSETLPHTTNPDNNAPRYAGHTVEP